MPSHLRATVPGAAAPILNDDLLSRIQELNRDYVELLILESAASAVAPSSLQLPAHVCAKLLALSTHERAALAATPYALYSLAFDDSQFWCAVADGTREGPLPERYRAREKPTPRSAFCEIALLMAWHVANAHSLALRVLYAIPDDIALALGRMQLWQLRLVAVNHCEQLMPRWPSNPTFWPQLLRGASSGSRSQLALAQNFGAQLIAAELNACIEKSRIHGRRPRPERAQQVASRRYATLG